MKQYINAFIDDLLVILIYCTLHYLFEFFLKILFQSWFQKLWDFNLQMEDDSLENLNVLISNGNIFIQDALEIIDTKSK